MAVTYHAGRRIQGLADDRLLTTEAVYTSVTGTSTYEKLSGSAQTYSSEKAGVELVSTANDGKKIKIGKWKLAREGTLSGLAYMKVEDGSGNLKATSTGVDVSSITVRTSGYEYVTFTLPTAVKVYNGYRVYIEYTTADGSGNFLAFGEFYDGSTAIPTGFESIVYNKRDVNGNNPSGGWTDDGLPTLIIPDAIFDDVPVTDENQITNVQLGSRYEETDTRKMYNYTDPLIFDDDFTSYADISAGNAVWVSENTSYSYVDVNNDNLKINQPYSTSVHAYVAKDLGTNVSNTAWVCRYKLNFSTWGTSSEFHLTLHEADQTVANNATGYNVAGIRIAAQPSPDKIFVVATSSGSDRSVVGSGSSFTVSTATDYFVEMIRNGNDFTVTVRTGSHSGTTSATATETVSGIDSLRYFKISNIDWDATLSTGDIVCTLDDFEFYNGTASTSNYWQEIGA